MMMTASRSTKRMAVMNFVPHQAIAGGEADPLLMQLFPK
jgi:hypothetical protein